MSKFTDFLTGGNTKVAANDLANMHYSFDGDYSMVLKAVFVDICQRRPNNNEFFNYFLGNRIRNYCDLAAIQLNALSAPLGTPISHTIMDFEAGLAKYIRLQKIPEKLITGNNTTLTLDLTEYVMFSNEYIKHLSTIKIS